MKSEVYCMNKVSLKEVYLYFVETDNENCPWPVLMCPGILFHIPWIQWEIRGCPWTLQK